MPLEKNTIQQIWKRAFPRAGSEAIGERALEMVLADAAVPRFSDSLTKASSNSS